MTISLVNVAKYYNSEPNQEKALRILQAELEKTHPHLLAADSEFIKLWKTPDESQVTTTVTTTTASVVLTASKGNTEEVSSMQVKTSTVVATKAASTVQLAVPYFSQLNNEQNPHGSCNVTSVAMCLAFLGYNHTRANYEQLEDELYRYCLNNGLSRHSPTDLAKLIRIYGYKDNFQPDAKWGDVKKWLEAGKPCIVHGWFSRSGHIIVIVGYNEKGWIVHDPYGEWFEWGYDTSVSGKNLTYSYGMMREVCGSDGDLWIHYVSK